jgi:hypothetical protein
MKRNPKKSTYLNLGIALLTATLLAIFVFWNRLPGLQPAAPEALAKVISGENWLRSENSDNFQKARLGTELHHQDAVWIPVGKEGELELYDGKRLVLQERTLLILRKPFIAPYDGEEAGLPFRVLQGKVQAKNFKAPERALDRTQSTNKEKTAPAPSVSESPSPEISPPLAAEDKPDSPPSPSVRRADVHPKDGGTVLVTAGTQTRITFSWPEAVTGKIELSRKDSSERKEFALEKVRFHPIDITLDPQGAPLQFTWSIFRSDGSTVTGPHSLTVQKLSREKMSEMLLKANEPDSMIYIQ